MSEPVFLPPLQKSAQDEADSLRPNFNEDGLIAAIAQDVDTREILMLAWMNEEALKETIKQGRAVYWSRSRNQLWRKGDTSGAYQIVHSIFVDCDQDAVLLNVSQTDGACHTGRKSCFYRQVTSQTDLVFTESKPD